MSFPSSNYVGISWVTWRKSEIDLKHTYFCVMLDKFQCKHLFTLLLPMGVCLTVLLSFQGIYNSGKMLIANERLSSKVYQSIVTCCQKRRYWFRLQLDNLSRLEISRNIPSNSEKPTLGSLWALDKHTTGRDMSVFRSAISRVRK